MTRIYNRVVPIRVRINVVGRVPSRSLASEEPLVYFRAKVSFDTLRESAPEPLWVEGEVQVFSDRSVELVWVAPQYGSIQGSRINAILDVYRESLIRAIRETDLALLGVT